VYLCTQSVAKPSGAIRSEAPPLGQAHP